MRGTPFQTNCIGKSVRITPAHAGNTEGISEIEEMEQDHPRPCGEHFSTNFVNANVLGSPPPMRGTLTTLVLTSAHARITPAHAGNTILQRVSTFFI